MNGDYVLYVIFAIMAIAFWNEKGSWLFAGYNMMSDKEKQKYDHKKLCRVMSCCVGTVDILPVSYTHLDVYKRQSQNTAKYRNRFLKWSKFGVKIERKWSKYFKKTLEE